MWHVGSYFSNQGLSPHALHWKGRVLITGPPGKSPQIRFSESQTSKIIYHQKILFITHYQISPIYPKKDNKIPRYVHLITNLNLLGCELGFPGGSDSKESTSNTGGAGSIPGSGRSPGEGHVNPLQCSCLENSMDRGALWV